MHQLDNYPSKLIARPVTDGQTTHLLKYKSESNTNGNFGWLLISQANHLFSTINLYLIP
ncbi:hypothetical protein ZOSMA_50G00450 [Zostera marina]|uniref:Uncharacterized protein n=1 Tax=Zostera marina TaxID=29655 RepID=A0A0K9P0A9_ZOSMR|nr:hypothetical protein ZOSMA_50G00450 [Zostera marina]